MDRFVNHSGGAAGADTYWHIIGEEFGVHNHKHYVLKSQSTLGSILLKKRGISPTFVSEKDEREGQKMATLSARRLGRIDPTYEIRSSYLIRNWAQVKYADAVFAISSILLKGESIGYGKFALIPQVRGGTGYTVDMAIQQGKPVYVYDQTKKTWWTWGEEAFIEVATPCLTFNFAGIGTRAIVTSGICAIRNVYQTTWKGIC